MRDSISFDVNKLDRLKVAYRKAVSAGLEQFSFEGHELLTAYARYLIEYLEQQFSRGE